MPKSAPSKEENVWSMLGKVLTKVIALKQIIPVGLVALILLLAYRIPEDHIIDVFKILIDSRKVSNAGWIIAVIEIIVLGTIILLGRWGYKREIHRLVEERNVLHTLLLEKHPESSTHARKLIDSETQSKIEVKK